MQRQYRVRILFLYPVPPNFNILHNFSTFVKTMKLTLRQFFDLFPFPVTGSNLGYHTVFSCHASLISSNLRQFLNLFFFFFFLQVLGTFKEYWSGILYNVLFKKCFLMIRLVLWVFGKNFQSYYIKGYFCHDDLLLMKLTLYLAKVLCARLLYHKITIFFPFHTLFFGTRSLNSVHNQQVPPFI